jgi:hypothetical protein
MDPNGTWRVPLLVAAGRFDPVDHRPSRSARVDGYQVDLAGDPVPGRASHLTLTVGRASRPVTDLEPYLAAYGHLVALREGDLAYLHVHPEGTPGGVHTAAFTVATRDRP